MNKVFRFSVENDYREWVVAETVESATGFVQRVTDIYTEYQDGTKPVVEVKELTELEIGSLYIYQDENMKKRITAHEAMANRREKLVPYLLCSSID